MRDEKNDFNIHLGDTIYSDSEVGGAPPALTVEEKWEKYRLNISEREPLPAAQVGRVLQPLGRPRVHQRLLDSRGRRAALPGRGQGVPQLRARSRTRTRTGLYRTFRWGKNLELFFLDQRSFRSAKADFGGACDIPGTDDPDLAPTAPQSTRNAFAPFIPSLANPVSQQCKNIDQRSRPHDARQASVRPLHQRRRQLAGPVEDRRQRDADPAVLRPPVRPLGGIRVRANSAC